MKKQTRFAVLAGLATLLVVPGGLLFAAPASATTPDLVVDFGANGSDSSSDRSAINAALAAGTRVHVPAGHYVVDGDLSFATGSWLDGEPGATIEIKGDYKFFGDGTNNVGLTNLTIERTIAANTATNSVISLWRSHDVTFTNLVINNAKTTAPVISVVGRWENTSDVNTCYNVRINNNTIQDYQRISPDGLGSGSLQGVKGTGILLGHCKTFDISNNVLDDNSRYFSSPSTTFQNFQGAGIAVGSSIYGVVSGNTVDYAGQGIDIGGGYNIPDRSAADIAQTTSTGFRGTSYTSVHDNTMIDIYGPGIKLVNGASNNSITDNTVTRAGLTGIWLAPGTTATQNETIVSFNIVSDNTVVDPGAGAGEDAWLQTAAGSGIVLEWAAYYPGYTSFDSRVRYNTITNNDISSTTGDMPYGIYDAGVLNDSAPQMPIKNYVITNRVNGSSIADFSIDPARNISFNN